MWLRIVNRKTWGTTCVAGHMLVSLFAEPFRVSIVELWCSNMFSNRISVWYFPSPNNPCRAVITCLLAIR